MRKGLLNFAALLVAMFMTSAVMAQETSLQTSTAEAPVWYNVNSAATAPGATNAGLAQVTSTGSFGEIVKGTLPVAPATTVATQNQDKYLWRFENDGSGNIYMINKLSGMKLANPSIAVAGLTERFRMNTTGSTFTFTAVTGITTGTVTGTAFYFTPTEAAFSAVGRVNCDGGVAELLLFKGGTNGDILQTGGKGSLYWLRKVLMKSVSVSIATASTGTGTVAILKDDAVTPEATQTVSKAQSIGVTVVATTTNGSFLGWKNITTGLTVSTSASYTYTDAADIQLEAVFGTTTDAKQVQLAHGIYPNPFNNSLTVDNAVTGTKISLLSLNGAEVLSTTLNSINTEKVQKGAYILKYTTLEGTKTVKVIKE